MTTFKIILSIFSVVMVFRGPAHTQDDFFSGKTVRIVVGSSPGGGYDYWARLLARHMPKYIHGNPEVIVQNMRAADHW
jgi:tripartite-type tricarboxylate transporter receptor subunit TctC